MANISLQDLTAIIHSTSRYNGNQYDLVHVETIIQTSEPIPPELNWFIPNGTSIPPEIAAYFSALNVKMYPMSEQSIINGTQDVLTQAQANNIGEVEKDTSMLLLRSIMKKGNLELVTGSTNLYHVSYDYKLFPNNNIFEFIVCLPFDGLAVQNGGAIQMTVITPLNAQIDNSASNAQTLTGQLIPEQITQVPNISRQIVSFRFQQDPLVNIKYHY